MDNSVKRPVNHHADHPGFAGPLGLFAGLTMVVAGRARARVVVDLAGVSSADRAVDIGCGPGGSVRAAARSAASVIGVDPAETMLGLARLLSRGRPNISWVQGSAENLPLPQQSATVMWSVATVHHWKDVSAGLASHGWTDQQAASFADCCRRAGFDDVRVDTLQRGRRNLQVVKAVRATERGHR